VYEVARDNCCEGQGLDAEVEGQDAAVESSEYRYSDEKDQENDLAEIRDDEEQEYDKREDHDAFHSTLFGKWKVHLKEDCWFPYYSFSTQAEILYTDNPIDFLMTEERNVYVDGVREELVENDELSPEEEGFMKGYEDANDEPEDDDDDDDLDD
jgi:hypothetical protein